MYWSWTGFLAGSWAVTAWKYYRLRQDYRQMSETAEQLVALLRKLGIEP